MRLGMIGLGRMGGNMVRRLAQNGEHELIVYDQSADAIQRHVGKGITAAKSIADLAKQLSPPPRGSCG